MQKRRSTSALIAVIYLVVLSLLLNTNVVSAAEYGEWTLLDTDDFESSYEGWTAYNTYDVAVWIDRPALVPYHGSLVFRTSPHISDSAEEVGDVGMTKTFTAPSCSFSAQINFTAYIRSRIYRDGSIAGYNGSFISVDGVLLWNNFISPAAMAPDLGHNETFYYWQEVQVVVTVEGGQTITVRIGSRGWQAQPTSGLNELTVLLDWVNVYTREQTTISYAYDVVNPHAFLAINVMSLALIVGFGAALIISLQSQDMAPMMPVIIVGVAVLIVLFIALSLLSAFSGL